MAERTYQAFVSYRHAERDTQIATEVQHGLERFVIPKALRKDGMRHIAPVFRDKEELSATPELDGTIEAALNNSETLVVICSPKTSESPWVQREIDLFLTTHDRSRIFTVLAEGASGDAIPRSLYYEKEELTSSGETVTRYAQPLSCDFRSDSRSEHKDELARLVAAILEVPYDALVRRAAPQWSGTRVGSSSSSKWPSSPRTRMPIQTRHGTACL